MHSFIQPPVVMMLFVLFRLGDLAICAAGARDTLRALCYGIVAILALISLIVVLIGIH